MIPVTAAIIEKNGLIFAARRGPKEHLAGHWEFPGGKIEHGETPEQCLRRELEEELSIQCEIGSFVAKSIFDYGDKTIQLLGYHARHIGGIFQLTDHDDSCWLPVEELSTLRWAPADIPLVSHLQNDAITQTTLDYYNLNANEYIVETKDLEMRIHREKFMSLLSRGGHILDLGCGSGRDSLAFLDNRYTVTAIDGSTKIAAEASKRIGQKVIVQLASDLNEIEAFDGIWASATLLHIPLSQQPDIFKSITKALKPGGICYMSFKHGEGERWDNRNRFFTDHTVNSITKLLQLPQIIILGIYITSSTLQDTPQEWLNIFCRKNPSTARSPGLNKG